MTSKELSLLKKYKPLFEYLFKLRASGRCNMWEANRYLSRECKVPQKLADDVHLMYIERCGLIAKKLGITLS